MPEEKAGPQEVMVYGTLLLVFFNLGMLAVSVSEMDVSGREVPAHPALAMMAGIGMIAALAATFTLAVRYFGAKAGTKLVFSNLGAGILIVTGASAAVAFGLRAVFGPAMVVVLPIVWAGAVYATIALARKRGFV